MGSVKVLYQKCRDVGVRHPFGGICVVSSIHSSCGAVSILCARKNVMVFLRFSRVAHVSAHHCRSSVGLVSHRFVSYRTAGTAFLEKLFYVFLGGIFWDASVGFAFRG